MRLRRASITAGGARKSVSATQSGITSRPAYFSQRELWVPEKGLYRDGKPFQTHVKPGQWLPADKEIETFTAHLQFLVALYDLAPKERQTAIVERAITAANFSCQPYFMHFVFAALVHTGLFEKHAPEQLKRWKVVEETQSLREM